MVLDLRAVVANICGIPLNFLRISNVSLNVLEFPQNLPHTSPGSLPNLPGMFRQQLPISTSDSEGLVLGTILHGVLRQDRRQQGALSNDSTLA